MDVEALFSTIEEAASPELAAWMGERRSVLIGVLVAKLELAVPAAPAAPATHEKRPLDADALTFARFVVLDTAVGAVVAKANELGVDVEIEKVQPDDVIHLFPPMAETIHASQRSYDAAARTFAGRMAAAYSWVTASAPQPPERVVGLAEREGDHAIYFTIPGEEDHWTQERMDSTTFTRCDLCGRAIQRVKIYLVQQPDGSIMQVGGQCAENMDLAKRLSNLLRAFKSFVSSLQGAADEYGIGEGSGKTRIVDPITGLAVAEMILQQRGYVSSKRKKETDEASNKDVFLELLADRAAWEKATSDPAVRTRGRQIAEEVPAWLEWERNHGNMEPAMLHNLETAVATGSLRLAGFLVYIPQGIRAWKEKQTRLAATADGQRGLHPWAPQIPFVASGRVQAKNYVSGWSGRRDEPTDVLIVMTPAEQPTLEVRGDIHPAAAAAAQFLVDNMLAPVRVVMAGRVDTAYVDDGTRTPYPPQVIAERAEKAVLSAFRGALQGARPDSDTTGKITFEPQITGDLFGALVDADPAMLTLLGITERSANNARKRGAGTVAAAIATKVGRYIPGVWEITRKRAFESDFGTTSYMSLQRPDGALIEWKKSGVGFIAHDQRPDWYTGSGDLDVGDKLRILSATPGLVAPPHPTYGINGRSVRITQYKLVQ